MIGLLCKRASFYSKQCHNEILPLWERITSLHIHQYCNKTAVQFPHTMVQRDSVSHFIPYLLVYKSTSSISRPPIFKVKNRISHHFGKTNEIHTNRNFPKLQSVLPENVLKTRWIKKSRGLIIRSEVYQDHNLCTYELFDLLKKYFTIFGSKSHCIDLPLISILSLKGDFPCK